MTARENQNATMTAGDKVSLRFPIDDGSSAAASLTTPTGVWKAAKGLDSSVLIAPTLSISARIETETISAATWSVAYIDIAESDTLTLAPGKYYHQLRITNTGPTPLVVASGYLTIKPLIRTP